MMRQQNIENHPTMARDPEERLRFLLLMLAETHSVSSLAPVSLFPSSSRESEAHMKHMNFCTKYNSRRINYY